MTTIPGLLRQETELVKSSPPQVTRLNSLVAAHHIWLSYANQLIKAKLDAVKNPYKVKEYNQLFRAGLTTGPGKDYSSKIGAVFNLFDQYEYDVRQKRRQALSASIGVTDRFSLFFSVLLVIIGSTLAFYLVSKIARRIDSMVKLAEDISKGEFVAVNDDQNDELTNLSRSLNIMSQKLSNNIAELERKNSELDQFAYVVSHDLKAPIRGIANVVQWIHEDLANEISPNLKKYLNIIVEQLKRMSDLIDGLLVYARIARTKYNKETVDVTNLVTEIADIIVPRQFELTLNELPVLYTEKLLLTQVFSNLLSNAVKYAPGANAEIQVSCRANIDFYEFEVSDNGVGIDQAYHEKIFEIFQTLRDRYDEESTGIGLAIVKKIVQENGALFVWYLRRIMAQNLYLPGQRSKHEKNYFTC